MYAVHDQKRYNSNMFADTKKANCILFQVQRQMTKQDTDGIFNYSLSHSIDLNFFPRLQF